MTEMVDGENDRGFGVLLRQYRLAAGLTQEALAECAGMGRRSIQHLERGEVRPQRVTAHRLVEALALTGKQRIQFEALAQPVPRRRATGAGEGAALPGTPPAPHNLPLYLTSFVGRARESAEVTHLLAGARLLTLTGVGGCGKTRLAVQVAADLRDDFADGVCFVPLAPVSDPALVVATVAQALGLRESGEQPLQEILLGYLRDKDLLLIPDNFEQVVAAAPLVGSLLAAAPQLKVLVTSRTPLHVYGEQEFVVPPLGLPTPRQLPTIDVLTQCEAVALFVQRARLARADFAVTNENAPAVAEICVRLDGLPLAIELAAARVKLLSPDALLARLESRLQVLTGGARDLPARQQTLRRTIEWSYNLLDPKERTLFAWLSVFVGGCTLEAVEDVCARAGGLPGEVLDVLGSLVDKSLLRQEMDPAHGEPRFTMLETLREYALERLAQSGREDAVRAAHAGHVLALAEHAEPYPVGAGQLRWLARLEREHDNLRAALRWTQASGAREVGLRLTGAVWWFWYVRGYLSEGRGWLEGLLVPGGAKGSPVEAAGVRAKALNGAAVLAYQQGYYARATALCEESLALFQELGDPLGVASSLQNLGSVAYRQGDSARAAALWEESLVLRRQLGDMLGIASSLHCLGESARTQGDYARATVLLEESVGLKRELGDTWGLAYSVALLGNLASAQGDDARERVLYEESLALFRALADRWGIAMVLCCLGNVARKQGDYARATMLHAQSLAHFRELGDTLGIAWGLVALARVASASGTAPEVLERAARLVGAAVALRAAIGAPLEPSERVDVDRLVAALRAALGNVTFAAAWAAGQAMTPAEAITEALKDGDGG